MDESPAKPIDVQKISLFITLLEKIEKKFQSGNWTFLRRVPAFILVLIKTVSLKELSYHIFFNDLSTFSMFCILNNR